MAKTRKKRSKSPHYDYENDSAVWTVKDLKLIQLKKENING